MSCFALRWIWTELLFLGSRFQLDMKYESFHIFLWPFATVVPVTFVAERFDGGFTCLFTTGWWIESPVLLPYHPIKFPWSTGMICEASLWVRGDTPLLLVPGDFFLNRSETTNYSAQRLNVLGKSSAQNHSASERESCKVQRGRWSLNSVPNKKSIFSSSQETMWFWFSSRWWFQNIFSFSPINLGKILILINIYMGWIHQLVLYWPVVFWNVRAPPAPPVPEAEVGHAVGGTQWWLLGGLVGLVGWWP